MNCIRRYAFVTKREVYAKQKNISPDTFTKIIPERNVHDANTIETCTKSE